MSNDGDLGAKRIRLNVNGETIDAPVPVRRTLVDFLRQDLELTGSHVGCEQGICGACSVVVNGEVIRGCLRLAVQADGKSIETIEGATETGRIRVLQEAFYDRGALQCGFCTAGMLLTAAEIISREPNADRERIRKYLVGNYCRCTGYEAIVDAIEAALRTVQVPLNPEPRQVTWCLFLKML